MGLLVGRMVDMTEADMTGVDMTEVDMTEVDMTEVDMTEVGVEGRSDAARNCYLKGLDQRSFVVQVCGYDFSALGLQRFRLVALDIPRNNADVPAWCFEHDVGDASALLASASTDSDGLRHG
jgi:hypothetical protein